MNRTPLKIVFQIKWLIPFKIKKIIFTLYYATLRRLEINTSTNISVCISLDLCNSPTTCFSSSFFFLLYIYCTLIITTKYSSTYNYYLYSIKCKNNYKRNFSYRFECDFLSIWQIRNMNQKYVPYNLCTYRRFRYEIITLQCYS